jgi:hypothetical protein
MENNFHNITTIILGETFVYFEASEFTWDRPYLKTRNQAYIINEPYDFCEMFSIYGKKYGKF